jgi:hypothetical protein
MNALYMRSPGLAGLFFCTCLSTIGFADRADALAIFNATSDTTLEILTDRVAFPNGFGWGEFSGSYSTGITGNASASADTSIVPFQLPDGPYGGSSANSAVFGAAQWQLPHPNPDFASAFAETGPIGGLQYTRFVTDTPGAFSVDLDLTIDYVLSVSAFGPGFNSATASLNVVGVSGNSSIGFTELFNYTDFLGVSGNASATIDELIQIDLNVPLLQEVTEVYLITRTEGTAYSVSEPSNLSILVVGLAGMLAMFWSNGRRARLDVGRRHRKQPVA